MHALPKTSEETRKPPEFIEVKAGIYFRSIVLDKYEVVGQHRHDAAHATLVGSGAARLWIDGVWSADIPAGHAVAIEANKDHVFQALEPDTRLSCIWREDVAMKLLKEV